MMMSKSAYMWLGFCLVLASACAVAQTTVTSSGTTATTGNVPYVSAATSTSTTVSPSPITVSGSSVGIGTTPRQEFSVGPYLDIYSGGVNSPSVPSIRASAGNNLILNAYGSGTLYLNSDGGTGGVIVENGSNANVFQVSSGGNTYLWGAAATSTANNPSPAILLHGYYWNGTASTSDSWNIHNAIGSISTGTTPTSTLMLTHTGSSGAASVKLANATLTFADGTTQQTAYTGNVGTVTSIAAGAGLSGGTITGSGTISLPNVGTSGTYGTATTIPVLTTDAYGRVTGVTNTPITGLSSSWSSLTNPTTNLALSTGSFTTAFNAGSSTGANNLFAFSDTASNTGTGNLVNISTAANSTLNPFAVYSAAGSNPSIQVLAGGNVGIGTTTPGSTLEVNGNITITPSATSGAHITFADGSTQSTAYTGVNCGGDYAESVDVTGDRKTYEPGDVLVIGAESGSDVLKSAEPYSTLVAGIYSTKPGTVGRRQATDAKISTTEVPMAMVGIVPTKVSAENGSIKRGDLLVTSSTLGYAMKGTDRSRMLGAVVGKALGNLDSGIGVIEVLVTLQ